MAKKKTGHADALRAIKEATTRGTRGGPEAAPERTTARRGGKAKVTSVVLDAELREDLEKYAWAYKLNRSEVMEQALREFFKRDPPPLVTITPRKK